MARGTVHTLPTAERVARAGLLIWAPVLVAIGVGGWFLLRVEPGLPHYALALGGTLAALTGWGQEEDRRRTREAGFDYHLTKPVDFDRLAEILAAVPHAGPQDRG